MFVALGIVAIVVGLICIVIKKEKFESLFKEANAQKGTEVYSEENIAKRIKLVKIVGPIALVLGVLLVVIELTGWVYM